MSDITILCDQIIAAAMSVSTRGCDDAAMNNLAQLRGICQAAAKIKDITEKEDNHSA